jgi:hypothetical protein
MQLEARCKALLESTLEEYAVDGTATRMAETFSRALLQAADELFGKVAEAHREQLKTQAQFFEIKLSHSRKASQMTLKEKMTTLESSHSRHLVETVQSVQAGGNEALDKVNSELEAERAKVQQLQTKLSLAEGDVQRFITQYRAMDAKAKAAAAELARAQVDLQAAGALLHDATKASGIKVVSSASSSSEASIAEQLRRLLDATGEAISKLERRLAEQERAYADAQRELAALARGPEGLQEELRTARRQREEIASSLADCREMAEAAAVGAAREMERLQSESSRSLGLAHQELEQQRVAALVLVRELGVAERAWHEAVATLGASQREASAREHAWQAEAERLQRACDVQAVLQLETRQMHDRTSEKLLASQSEIIELRDETERETSELRAEIDELMAARAVADAASEAAAAEAAANLSAALAAAASGAGAVGASQREAIGLREEIRRLTLERDALLADSRAVSGAIDEGMAALDLGGSVVVVGVGGGGGVAGSWGACGGAASALGAPPPTTGTPTKPSSGGGGFAGFRAMARGESAMASSPRSDTGTHDDEHGAVSGVHSGPTLERVRAWAEAHAAERRERSNEKAQLHKLQEQTRERVRELEDQLVALRANKPVVVEQVASCRVCAAASQNALRLQDELSRAINECEQLRAALEEQTAQSAELSTAAARGAQEADALKLKCEAAENALATTVEELERVSEALERAKSRSQAESSRGDVDARIKEERAAFKEERDRLIQTALRALQQLRVYLSESLCGLRAPPPLSHTHDGAVLGLTRPKERTTSQTWHRWGAITSEADMGALVVRLEAPAAPPLGVRPVPLVHHQLPMPHEGARLPGAGGVMTSSLSDPLLRRRLHPKRPHKLADQMSTTTTTHNLRRAETADEPLGRARALFDPTETEQGRRTTSLPPVRPCTQSSPLRGTTLNPSSPLKSPSSPLKMEVKIRMSGPTPLERQLEPWSPSSP